MGLLFVYRCPPAALLVVGERQRQVARLDQLVHRWLALHRRRMGKSWRRIVGDLNPDGLPAGSHGRCLCAGRGCQRQGRAVPQWSTRAAAQVHLCQRA